MILVLILSCGNCPDSETGLAYKLWSSFRWSFYTSDFLFFKPPIFYYGTRNDVSIRLWQTEIGSKLFLAILRTRVPSQQWCFFMKFCMPCSDRKDSKLRYRLNWSCFCCIVGSPWWEFRSFHKQERECNQSFPCSECRLNISSWLWSVCISLKSHFLRTIVWVSQTIPFNFCNLEAILNPNSLLGLEDTFTSWLWIPWTFYSMTLSLSIRLSRALTISIGRS